MRAEFHFLTGVLAMIVVAMVAPALSPFVIIATFLSAPVTYASERVAERWTPAPRLEDQ